MSEGAIFESSQKIAAGGPLHLTATEHTIARDQLYAASGSDCWSRPMACAQIQLKLRASSPCT